MVKVLLLALVLTLVLANGSALKCLNCVPGNRGEAVTTQVTCGYKKDACVAARFTTYLFSYSRRCIGMGDCMMHQSSPYIKAKSCQTDLCNTPVF